MSDEFTIAMLKYMMLDDFTNESDRAVVIIAGCYIDGFLGRLLEKHKLISESEIQDIHLFIKINKSKKIFDTEFISDLHSFRKLRNDCAHKIKGCSFSSPSLMV